MIVYKITNLDNGKIYVGQTKFTVDKRFKEHAKSESYIGKAIRKYGEEQFDLEVLATCETREEAYELEIAFIEFFDCMAPNGYNLTASGIHNPTFSIRMFRNNLPIKRTTLILPLYRLQLPVGKLNSSNS